MADSLKFLLISPTAPEWRVQPGQKPPLRSRIFRFAMLTSLTVAASLPPEVEIQIVDEEVEAVDFDSDADLIGISCMTFNAPRAYEIADKFRLEKGKKVVLGGYHPTFLPREAILHADAVCIGEAEPNLPKIIGDFRNGSLKQFYAEGPADLNKLAIPNRRLVPNRNYIWADAVQATRGCKNRCTFCSITSFFGNTFRARPAEQVIAELKTLRKHIMFMDDNITTDKSYAKELFTAMVPLKKQWFSQCSITIADNDELLSLAAQSGCRGFFIGLESISQDNLHVWKKDFNRAAGYREAVKKLHANGIAVYAAIVLGYDADTPEVFAATLDFLLDSKVDALQCTILTPFPGTTLFEEMDKAGRIKDKDWSHYDFKHVVFQPARMSQATLQAGHEWLLTSFYSTRNVLSRIRNTFSYLDFKTVMLSSVPLNFSYRYRLKSNGVWNSQRTLEDVKALSE